MLAGMPIEIAPALEPEEWTHRQCGAMAIDRADGEAYVVVREPDGEFVSVSGTEELFALMALANDALPDGDSRKFTARDSEWFRTLASEVEMFDADAMRRWPRHMAEVLSAILPPP